MGFILPKSAGIVSKGWDEDVLMAKRLAESMEGRIKIIFDEKTAYKIKKEGEKIENMAVDFLICIGGDGTILRTLHSLEKPIPILGVNMGAIGFLAAVQPENAILLLSKVLEGFEVDRRERLSVKIKGEKMPYAINEVVVTTSKPAKILHLAIFMDDEELERMRADGVVFATPTGSTAYAMSAGGPIVDPRVDAHIIVPIAPFKLSARPTVVNASSKISLELLEVEEAELVIDGQLYRKIGKEDVISIEKGKPAFFVTLNDKFFLTVKNKLRGEETRWSLKEKEVKEK